MNRVVITGCGVVSPLGSTVADLWQGIEEGRCGIQSLKEEELPGVRARVVGRVVGYRDEDYYEPGAAKKHDLFIRYAVAAAEQAIASSGLTAAEIEKNPFRCGVAIGAAMGGLDTIEANFHRVIKRGAAKVSAHFVPAVIINMAAANVSMRHGLMGPNVSVVTACATGTHNIGMAAQMIVSGAADMMVAGGVEYTSVMLAMAGFSVMRALTFNPDPKTACRPFDVNRDGFVLSDGAGVLVLESYDHAIARGAPIIAEIAGFGMTADAHHVTQPSPDGAGAIQAMKQAIVTANCALEDVGYINAHGTSTPHNDRTEGHCIQKLFGSHAAKLMVSSTKSMLGHQLGAAGAVEAAICALALQKQVVPATINCHEPEPDMSLDFVRDGMRAHQYDYALSNSFGFGGNNASLLLRRFHKA